MSHVLLLGAGGQLASDIAEVWPEVRPADRLTGLGHRDLDICDPSAVRSALTAHRPDVVVNTAAYHRVDEIEGNFEQALQVNAVAVRGLAEATAEAGALLVHFSTDYVFSGFGRPRGRPYQEQEAPTPPNAYGVSKAAGEMALRAATDRHLLLRVGGLYGVAGSAGKGGNFVETMLRLAGSGNPVRVVDDQVLTPTHTLAIARQLAVLLDAEVTGTVHATCQGECSWYEFAGEIFRQAGLSVDLGPQSTAQSGAAARRPEYCALDNARLREAALDRMPAWQDALAAYMERRQARRSQIA